MTAEQELHLEEIKCRFAAMVGAKYRKGQAEHGGNLWEHDPEWFLNAAIDEAIDQVTYLLTMKEALRRQRENVPVEVREK